MTDAAYKRGYDRIVWKPIRHDPKPAAIAARSALSCPMIIGDSMPPAEHVDGKIYDSKSSYRAVTKAHGYIEVGNDPARFKARKPPRPDRAKIKEAVAKAVARHT